ncbi:MAG TPA: triphosphoribosyl-dephospho-CoA synthase [Candidatus Avidesulfovibrio excrementigallinarum]|nr:triphosphoribosyl-dephospho-CoA synthase [Candidatus Avidesulfovibrio excrementigallinarum]
MSYIPIPDGTLPPLPQVLDAREQRWHARLELARTHQRPVLSATLRLPHLLRLEYQDLLLREAGAFLASLPVVFSRATTDADGPHLLAAIDLDAGEIKRRALHFETSPAGALLDLDVTGTDGLALSRDDCGLPPRPCLVCGQTARECVRARRHSTDEVRAEVERRIHPDLGHASPLRRLAALARLAVEDDVRTHPKPGLVTPRTNGAHNDMDAALLLKSSDALAPYWLECVLAGHETSRKDTHLLLHRLKPLGLEAEQAMFAATGGVNTHKGLVFSLGLACAAAGLILRAPEPAPIPLVQALCREVCLMTTGLVERELATGKEPRTAGERAYLQHGVTGARGEAAAGFPTVRHWALPRLYRDSAAGLDWNSCRAHATLALMAHLRGDTNLIKRGGPEGLQRVNQEAAAALQAGGLTTQDGRARIAALEQTCLDGRLSAGGCADMLALACFLYRFTQTLPEAQELAAAADA